MANCSCAHMSSIQAALREAEKSLEETRQALFKAKKSLAEVEERVANLKANFEQCLNDKEQLAEKVETCAARLNRAEKVCWLVFQKTKEISC